MRNLRGHLRALENVAAKLHGDVLACLLVEQREALDQNGVGLDAIRAYVEAVDTYAEYSIQAGEPIEGAHYRAMRHILKGMEERHKNDKAATS